LQITCEFKGPLSAVIGFPNLKREFWGRGRKSVFAGRSAEIVESVERAWRFREVENCQRPLCSCCEIAELGDRGSLLASLPGTDAIYLNINFLRNGILG